MTDWGELNGPQKKIVIDAIVAGFGSDSLSMALVLAGKPALEAITAPAPFRHQVFELVQVSQREGWTAELIAVVQAESKNPRVQALSALPAAKAVPDLDAVVDAFERMARPNQPLIDMADFGDRLDEIRHRVCRIEDAARNALGTGFLVAADLVLTNHHVVVADMRGPHDVFRPAADIICRFDYAIQAGAQSDGAPIALGLDWLVAWSPRSAFDPGDTGGEPAAGELDFALLRLAEPVGDQAGPDGPKRGWVKVSRLPPRPQPRDILFIAQHPEGLPIKLGPGNVLDLNPSATRIRYDANTEPGSSGAPVFNAALDLVALHHAGDPNFAFDHQPTYNQGIVIQALIEHLSTLPTVPKFWQG